MKGFHKKINNLVILHKKMREGLWFVHNLLLKSANMDKQPVFPIAHAGLTRDYYYYLLSADWIIGQFSVNYSYGKRLQDAVV